MNKTPASKQTIKSLQTQAKDLQKELETVFPAIVDLREKISQLQSSEQKNTLAEFLGCIEDLMLGSNFILYELLSSFRLTISTPIEYEKRYHLQVINQCICEAYDYFVGNENNKGVWPSLFSMICALNNNILTSYAHCVDTELSVIRSFQNRKLRNCTSHYDQPILMYKTLSEIIDEDFYCKAVSQYMLAYMRIRQLTLMALAVIDQITQKGEKTHETLKKSEGFDLKNLLEGKLANTFSSDERLQMISEESLLGVSKSIDELYLQHQQTVNAKQFLSTQGIQECKSVDILQKLIALRMIVNYMRCDITCAMRAYMNSQSGIERSLNLRRIFLVEVSSMTHLYGYNATYQARSIWTQLQEIASEYDKGESFEIQKELDSHTAHLESAKRNLFTHFREGKQLNIINRYYAYKQYDQIKEVYNALNLLNLCKKIEEYTLVVLKRANEEETIRTEKMKNGFHSRFEEIRYMMQNSTSSEDMKAKTLSTINCMEEKLMEIMRL